MYIDETHTALDIFRFAAFLGGGPSTAWILVQSVAQTFKLSREAILQVSEDPYHTEIQALSGKFHNIHFLTLPEV